MILSDRAIRELLAEGKIVIDPLDPHHVLAESLIAECHLPNRLDKYPLASNPCNCSEM